MNIKGFEKLSLVDFDNKLSAVIFFGGCNFRCPFCHNYDLVMTPNNCDDIPFEDILAYLRKRKGVLDAVVFTGGEPTLSKDLKSMIKEVKDLGYLIKLDTNGTNPEIVKELIDEGLPDYIAMDIKASLDNYHLVSGSHCDLNRIQESINLLINGNTPYEFRTTIIEEYHNFEDIKGICTLISECSKYRLQKFIDRGTCLVDNLHEVKEEKAKEYINYLKDYIKDVDLRGY